LQVLASEAVDPCRVETLEALLQQLREFAAAYKSVRESKRVTRANLYF